MRATAGVAAGAVLGACADEPPASPASASTTSSPTPTSATPTVRPIDWRKLAAALDGRVVLPDDDGYTDAKSVFNSRFDPSRPAAVVVPSSEDDVRRAMEFAAGAGVTVAPRSGGHSYIGASARDGAMVIDLRSLAGEISYDTSTLVTTVPAAATLDSVQTTLGADGRLIPSGSCPSVGVAGLTLGGGLGTDSRDAGVTCDSLSSVRLVLPGGEVVTASPDDHPDLFWALRGGGGGNFGVATSFRFRTSRATDRDVVTTRFPDGSVADVLVAWQDFMARADRGIWSMLTIAVGPGAAGCTVVLATPAGSGSAAADKLAASVNTAPLSSTTRTLGRADFVRYFEGGPDASTPRAFLAGSDVIEAMTTEAADAIVTATGAWPAADGGATAVIESLTGAIQDVAAEASAFPWRRQAASIQWYAQPSTPGDVDVSLRWLAAAHTAVRSHSVGGYANYVEADVPARWYFADNLPRLTAVREQYDPDRVMGSGFAY